MSNFATKSEIPDVSNFATKSELPDMTDYYDKTEVDGLLQDAGNTKAFKISSETDLTNAQLAFDWYKA